VKEDAIMLVVHVHVHVKSERVEAFRQATLDNARNSINEPGIIRFDVIQQNDDPTRFVLIEIYRAADDPARHKQTAHYQTWRDTVAEMMAEPRSSVKYANVFPADAGWEMPDGKTTTGKTISSTKEQHQRQIVAPVRRAHRLAGWTAGSRAGQAPANCSGKSTMEWWWQCDANWQLSSRPAIVHSFRADIATTPVTA